MAMRSPYPLWSMAYEIRHGKPPEEVKEAFDRIKIAPDIRKAVETHMRRFGTTEFDFVNSETAPIMRKHDFLIILEKCSEDFRRNLAICENWSKPLSWRRNLLSISRHTWYSGHEKFVIIKLEDGQYRLASSPADRHHEVANSFYRAFGEELGKMWVIGGGWIEKNKEACTVTFSGYSSDFGACDPKLIRRLAEEALARDGCSEWQLVVRPSSLQYFREPQELPHRGGF